MYCTLIYKLVLKNKFIHDLHTLLDFKTQLSTLCKEHLYDGAHLSISVFFYITCIKAFGRLTVRLMELLTCFPKNKT